MFKRGKNSRTKRDKKDKGKPPSPESTKSDDSGLSSDASNDIITPVVKLDIFDCVQKMNNIPEKSNDYKMYKIKV
tara:strand:+ start:364 stop:588 length:225 start_codon:yes stop_codon:yes gene_type:complete